MIKHLCTWFILLFITSWCAAQAPPQTNRYTDSLEKITREAKGDSTRAKAHFSLCRYWLGQGDSAKAHDHIILARKTAAANPWSMAVSYYFEGLVLQAFGNNAKAEPTYLLADSLLRAFDKKPAYYFRAVAMHNYAVLQQVKGDEKAFTDILLNSAIPLTRQAADTPMLARNFHDVALAFKNTEQYDKAAVYVREAIEIYKNARARNADMDLSTAYITAAENEVLAGKYLLAKPLLDTARNLLAAAPGSPLPVDFYTAEGTYYNEIKKYDSALISIGKGLALARQNQQRYEEQRLLHQKYYAHFYRKEYQQALQVLQFLYEQPEMMALINNRLEIFKGFANTWAGLKNMEKAFAWAERYSNLSDSVHKSQLKNDIQALEIKYGNEENKKKIAALRMENEKAALAAKNNRLINWLLGSAVLLLLIVAAFVWIIYRKDRKISEQKDQHHQQQLKEIEQQQQIQFGQALLQGEERERRRVAGDLHDGLGGMLAGVKMNLAGMTAAPVANQEELGKVIGQLDHSISELRRIARNMMPEALLKFGLETALRDLCGSFKNGPVRISFQAYGIEPGIPQDKQANIYRIVQELLSNAIRHSQASEILLQCSQNGDMFYVTIEDNGKGFDPDAADKPKGMGLTNLKNRVDYLKGKMDITSAINEGTTINIEMNVAA